MRAFHAVPLVVATLVASLPARSSAGELPSGVVDRIVAVVGRDAILLSDVRARETPFLVQMDREKVLAADRPGKRAQIEKELLSRMVDEALEAAFAAAGHVGVQPEEVDRAEAAIAQRNGVSVGQLEDEARAQAGVTPLEYRAEIRRQVLDGKLVQLEVVPRIAHDPSRTEVDWMVQLDKERGHWLDELRQATHIDVRL
jgi:peptidyl-prolyl cis-trans isomerase SurA